METFIKMQIQTTWKIFCIVKLNLDVSIEKLTELSGNIAQGMNQLPGPTNKNLTK